jgi:hypothetical protein
VVSASLDLPGDGAAGIEVDADVFALPWQFIARSLNALFRREAVRVDNLIAPSGAVGNAELDRFIVDARTIAELAFIFASVGRVVVAAIWVVGTANRGNGGDEQQESTEIMEHVTPEDVF